MTDSQPEQPILSADAIGRQAIRSIGGYVFQLYHSMLAWLNLRDDSVLLLEVTEDYAVLCKAVISQTQIKDDAASGNITLRSKSVIDLINSHWDLTNSNQERTVNSVLLTTASIGAEQGLVFPDKMKGLDFWRVAARKETDLTPLKNALLAINIADEIKQFISNGSDEEIRSRIVRPIKWIANSDELATVRQSVRDGLVSLGEKRGVSTLDSERVEFALLGHLIETILSSETRRLTRVELLRVFDEATRMSVPLQLVQQLSMAGALFENSTSVLPGTGTISSVNNIELSPRIAARSELVHALSSKSALSGFLWLNGSSGLGKTTLALQMAKSAEEGEWLRVDLSGCNSEDLRIRLFLAVRQLIDRTASGVILDDFPSDVSATGVAKLAQFVFEARENDCITVVTSGYEPTPEIVSRFASNKIEVVPVPYLSVQDVEELVKAQGGDPAVWAKMVHAICGFGHPQLVNAYIHGLSTRNWPESEILNQLPKASGNEEILKQKDSVLRRLVKELPPDIKSFLYRLSLALPDFDRELALAIAGADPSIENAAEGLAYLVGPWLENRGELKYLVSPLVSDSGSNNLSESQITNIRKAIIQNLIHRDPFPADQLLQLLFNAYKQQHFEGLSFFCDLMLSNAIKKKDFPMLAQAVSSFPYFLNSSADSLFPGDKKLAAMLRTIQCLVAIATANARVPTLFEQMIKDCKLIEDRKTSLFLLFNATSQTLSNPDLKVEPKLWLDALNDFNKTLQELDSLGIAPKRTTTSDEFSLTEILFAVRASAIKDIGSLEALFAELDKFDIEYRDNLFKALQKLSPIRLLIDNPWLAESKQPSFDGVAAAASYAHIAEFAQKWEAEELFIHSICAQAVLLDEYAEDHESALRVIENTLSAFPDNYFLLRRKQTVLYRKGDHRNSLQTFEKLTSVEMLGDAVDNLYSLRDASRSAIELNDLQQARSLFERGWSVADKAGTALQPIAVGLLADCAVTEFLMKNHQASLEFLVRAIRATDNFEGVQNLQTRYCLNIIPHVIVWMRQELGKLGPGNLQMKPGICSNPNPDQSFNEYRIPPRHAVLYQFAALESDCKLDVGAMRLLRDQLNGKENVFLEAHLSKSIIGKACCLHDVALFVRELPRHMQLMNHLNMPELPSQDEIFTTELQPAQLFAPNWNDLMQSTHFRLAVSAFSVAAFCDNRVDTLTNLLNELKPVVEIDSKCFGFLSLIEGAESTEETLQLLDLIAMFLARWKNPEELISPRMLAEATVYFAQWLCETGFSEYVSEIVVTFFCSCWSTTVKANRALLNRPFMTVPAIEAVCTSNDGSAATLAKLALAIDGVTSIQLSTELKQRFMDYIAASIPATQQG